MQFASSANPELPTTPAPAPADAPVVEEIPNWYQHLPKSLQHTRRYGGNLCLAGQGKVPAEIMFVQTAVGEQETAETIEGTYGPMAVKPRYLRGPAGCILKDTLASMGIKIEDHYYTTLVKWLLPRTERMKPKRHDIEAAKPILDDEIKRVSPKIIVTFGKPAFDAVVGMRVKFDDVRAAWFWSEKYQCKVFVMQDVMFQEFKPEFVEKYRMELLEVQRMLDQTRGIEIVSQPCDYQVISNAAELDSFCRMLAGEKKHMLSVDAEFGGRNFIDGYLRSLQVAFDNGQARYIRFMNDRREYVFDVPYRAAGEIMKPHFDDPLTKYIGYHISVDLPWMHHWLKLEWYNKCFMDCEYAQQVLDENVELGLERLALQYTDLGRYDIDLLQWKAANPDSVSDELGYLLVPDEILVPYGCKDVDAPFRACPQIAQRLMWDKTWDYYVNYRHKLVTDIFTQFALAGMPVAKAKMDDLRDLYQYSRELLERKFVKDIAAEARGKLLTTLMNYADPQVAWETFNEIDTAMLGRDPDRARNVFKRLVGAQDVQKQLPVMDHYIEAPGFNLRSADHKARWLFDVKGFTPVKSTNNKEKGLPSIPWERVMNLPPNVARQYNPSTDKQSVKIIADDTGDPLVNQMMDVLAVGNVCKAFLKEAEIDDETGELVKENGLHYWLCSDGRIHGQYSVTETGRPRSWKPNQLNWPSYVHKGVARGIAYVMKEQKDLGQLPERFERYLDPSAIPSIRSVIDVVDIPPVPGSIGWCLVESDYQTAEIRGLGFLSGDENLIRLVTEPDDQFGVPIGGNLEKDRVRLSYAPDCGIPEANRRQEFIGKQAAKGKIICEVPMENLIRNADGTLYHPPHDLHWSLVEWVMELPRELFDEKIERTGTGKVGNFSSAYGATANTLERKIKADTGKTPPPGTGQRILDALRKRQPVATAWLEMLATLPDTQGWWQSEAGSKRRFVTHRENVRGLSFKARKGILSTLGREARNFPMQGSVADTAVRAGDGLLNYYRNTGLHARPMAILYDSCVTLCPIEERFIVLEAHERFMTRENNWHNHGRNWNYPSSHEFNYAWSARPSKAQQKQLDDVNWHSVAPWLQRAA